MAIEPDGDRNRTTGDGQHGTSRIDEVGDTTKKKTNWLPLILGALALLALLFALSQCGRDEPDVQPVVVDDTIEPVTTPDVSGETAAAGTIAAGPADTGNILTDLRGYLGSGEAAGRRFSFNDVKFATDLAEVPADAQTTITGLADVFKASPTASVRLEGYADAVGDAKANAELGARRAAAIKTALDSAGIETGRIATATGGESNPVDSSADASGRTENRRADLIVTAK